jgi:NAD(P)-dependent dehydrogenase (short-subunit alcohol dehydrogenase family)
LPGDPEDPEFAAAADATDLRRVLIARGEREPAAIESSVARLLAAREIRANLTALDNAGVKVSYHAVDVRDADALGGVVDSVYDRHGRLDGIVHGAGVIEDRLLADKTPESFRRVFDTKVGAAHTLVSAVRDPHPFLVLFTSVSGAFGNKGQVDYAAANDALATLAWSLDAQQFGPVVAVDWGPWAGSGMVTPQLDREYARRGVGLVHPDDGVARLLDELRLSLPEPEIVLARARVSTFEAPSGPMGDP